MNLIILGPPGSGKGTQARLLAEKYGLTHISSGQLLRAFAEGDSAKAKAVKKLLSTGELLPFETVLEVIGDKLKQPKGFVLDGVPRNKAQLDYMDTYFKDNQIELDLSLYLRLPDEEAVKRVLKRAEAEGRSDDTSEVIRERLKVYHQETEPILQHYRQQGKLLEIDGAPSIEIIFQDIISRLKVKFPDQF